MARNKRRNWRIFVLFASCGFALSVGSRVGDSGEQPSLKVAVDGLKSGGVISTEFAFCVPAEQGHVALGPNKSPAIGWSKGRAGTTAYALIMQDPDMPSVADDANKEGRTIAATLKRVTFYHWVLVDIPASVTRLPIGADSNGVTAHGKPLGPTEYGVRGINDYTRWFANDTRMAGVYGGYDGPCPPWNDSIVHHYHFTVYALNVKHLGVSGKLTGPEALAGIRKHVLAKGEAVGTYTLNPAVAKRISSLSQGQQGTLSGRVSIGPLCPIEPCPYPKPDVYSSRELILQPQVGNPIRIKLTPDGTFWAKVDAGIYSVNLTNCVFLGCKYVLPQTVTIKPSETTTLNIDIDTGIR